MNINKNKQIKIDMHTRINRSHENHKTLENIVKHQK